MNERWTELWLSRNGETLRQAPPEVADAIANHTSANPKCAFCGEDHEDAAIMAWRDGDFVLTVGVCRVCAMPSDEPKRFGGWAASHYRPRH
jgi:hypothetical protein